MRRDQLPLITLDGRHAGELLAHPCDCSHQRCTLGDHLWQSTLDMGPGPRANNTDPRTTRTWPTHTDDQPDPPDTTSGLHTQYRDLLANYQQAARALTHFIDSYRPDRWIPLPSPLTDEDWCRNHLAAGICESRYKGDLCAWCYSVGYAHGHVPDVILIRYHHQGRRLTQTVIDDFLARVKVTRNTRGRKASRDAVA